MGPLVQGILPSTFSSPQPTTTGFSFPSLPSLPSFPSFPSFPTFGSSTGFSFPSLPTLPSLPTVPTSFSTVFPSSIQGSGGYMLQLFFYFFLYGFVIFLILMLIHFTIYPVFQFVPGGKGIIPIPTTSDYSSYWIAGTQPTTAAPDTTVTSDQLAGFLFKNNYTVSIDICIGNVSGHSGFDRLLFYMAPSTSSFNPTTSTFNSSMSLSENFGKTFQDVSMICYIDDNTNDLLVTYFFTDSSSTSTPKPTKYVNSFPIQNIPLHEPFRLSLVYDTNIYTVYLNGVQVSQTSVAGLTQRTTGQSLFYPNTIASKCGNVQTLLLWNRPLQYAELVAVPVSLTALARFTMPPFIPTAAASTCS